MRSKTLQPGLVATLIAYIIIPAGCEKIGEILHHSGNGDADLKICAIKNITVYAGANTVHYKFTNNKWSDPVSVINDMVSTGNPNLFFTYDKNNRLSELLRAYTNGSFETWSRYGYNNKQQIVFDTMYGLGALINGKPSAESAYGVDYITYTYDEQDRIVMEKDSVVNIGNGQTTGFFYKTYNYDTRGNLATNSVYDDKLNIRRTNKIWMFITKDYSVNNPFIATAYNDHNLPLSFQSQFESLGAIAPIGGSVTVEYACR